MDFKETRTYQNLINSFAGESQARTRYTFYASIANKEGLLHVEAIFLETADNERAHAKVFWNYLMQHVGNFTGKVSADYPFEAGTTAENLAFAAAGEHEEYAILYSEARDVAREEGFEDIAKSFQEILEVEEHHEARFLALQELVAAGKYFKRDEPKVWKCRNCGYVHEGPEAPDVCPACKHPQKYFEVTSLEQ
ncbi:MAG: rubrerythrin family protein [Anaerolineaceae bacterium]|nr:rubrerythrin family protein [Anaerolineaceae bacterium]